MKRTVGEHLHLFNISKEGFKFHYLDCDMNRYSWSKVLGPIVYFDFSEEQIIFMRSDIHRANISH